MWYTVNVFFIVYMHMGNHSTISILLILSGECKHSVRLVFRCGYNFALCVYGNAISAHCCHDLDIFNAGLGIRPARLLLFHLSCYCPFSWHLSNIKRCCVYCIIWLILEQTFVDTYDISTNHLRALFTYWCHVCWLRLSHRNLSQRTWYQYMDKAHIWQVETS